MSEKLQAILLYLLFSVIAIASLLNIESLINSDCQCPSTVVPGWDVDSECALFEIVLFRLIEICFLIVTLYCLLMAYKVGTHS